MTDGARNKRFDKKVGINKQLENEKYKWKFYDNCKINFKTKEDKISIFSFI